MGEGLMLRSCRGLCYSRRCSSSRETLADANGRTKSPALACSESRSLAPQDVPPAPLFGMVN